MTYTPHEDFTAVAAAPRQGISAWGAIWIVAAFIGALILWHDLSTTRWTGDGSIEGVALWGRDFVNVYTSGSLTLSHRLDLLYDVDAYRAYQLDLFDASLKWHNYSYPPVTLLYTWVLALLPYPVAVLAWLGGTGAFFAWAARPYLKEAALPTWFALLVPASLINLWAGHYGFLIGGLWLSAWHYLPRRPVLSGILIGLMVVKPHLAVLLPIVLIWRREWRAVAAAAITVIVLVGLSALLFGTELWITYLTRTALFQAALVDDVGSFFIRMMPTLMPSLAEIGVPTAPAAVLQAVVAIAAIAVLVKRLPQDAHRAGLATATATFLVLPYAFSYDMTVVNLGALLLFRRAEMEGDRSRPYLFGAANALLLPMTMLLFGFFQLPVAPLVLAFQLAALLRLEERPRPA